MLYCAFYWVLRKIKEDTARVVIVVPVWKNQPFWPMLMKLLIARPVLLSAREALLSQPSHSKTKHSLRKKLMLLICTVSRNGSDNEVFLERQPTCSRCYGGNQQCTICTYQDGADMQIKNKWIVLPPLESAVKFLTSMAHSSASYSAVAKACSALSCFPNPFEGAPFGQNVLVKRLVKGVFINKLTLPKQISTWDVNSFKRTGIVDSNRQTHSKRIHFETLHATGPLLWAKDSDSTSTENNARRHAAVRHQVYIFCEFFV